MRPNLDENQAFLTRKLDHYNAWLLDPKRPFTEIYPGFPEEAKREAQAGRKRTERRSATLPSVVSKPKIKRERSKKGQPTKQELAVRLVELNPKKEEAIFAIMNELNMTKAGATTYFYNAKKILGAK